MEEHEYSTYQVRCRAVTAVLNGRPASTVAETYGVHRGTVYRWLARYREEDGVAGLTRRPVSGRPRKLAELTEKELEDIVLRAYPKTLVLLRRGNLAYRRNR